MLWLQFKRDQPSIHNLMIHPHCRCEYPVTGPHHIWSSITDGRMIDNAIQNWTEEKKPFQLYSNYLTPLQVMWSGVMGTWSRIWLKWVWRRKRGSQYSKATGKRKLFDFRRRMVDVYENRLRGYEIRPAEA